MTKLKELFTHNPEDKPCAESWALDTYTDLEIVKTKGFKYEVRHRRFIDDSCDSQWVLHTISCHDLLEDAMADLLVYFTKEIRTSNGEIIK